MSLFERATLVSDLMHLGWAWPVAESLHFIGLSLLIGTIGTFDLRLLGVASRVPIAAFDRLARWGLVGFGLNAATGVLFLLTAPAEYVFNAAFHFKLVFVALAGLNALAYHAMSYRHHRWPAEGRGAPRGAKIFAAASLLLWTAVIVCGRLLTFYRPGDCTFDAPGFLADCL